MANSPPSFLKLTDTDQVRSVIGIDATDVTDTQICDMKPEEDLESSLLSWVPAYQTVISEGATAAATADQKLKYLKLKLFSKYFVAGMVVTSGWNSILQKQSDGANEGIRFTNITLNQLKNHIEGKAAKLQEELLNLIVPDTVEAYPQFSAVSPTFDPVTNA